MHDADAQRAAGGLQSIARSRSAPAATLRSYASNYAAGLLHQARHGGVWAVQRRTQWRSSRMRASRAGSLLTLACSICIYPLDRLSVGA